MRQKNSKACTPLQVWPSYVMQTQWTSLMAHSKYASIHVVSLPAVPPHDMYKHKTTLRSDAEVKANTASREPRRANR